MNSFEFMQQIHGDIGGLRAMFDSTMGLYRVIGGYNGLQIINQEVESSAVICYTVVADNPSQITSLVEDLNGVQVTVYDHSYRISAELQNGNYIYIRMNIL